MILEDYQYVIGTKKSAKLSKEPYRAEKDIDLIVKEMFSTKSKTAMKNLEATNSANAFYKAEPDLCFYIEKERRDEYFYIMKSGMYSPVVPAKLLYMLQECFKQHGTYNMLFNFIPKKNIEEITAGNYLADEKLNIQTIIQQGFYKEFCPISEGNLIVPNYENFDVYIKCSDRILIIPPKLRKEFDQINIMDIKMSSQGLVINGMPLSQLGKYLGVYNCEYDYRNLI